MRIDSEDLSREISNTEITRNPSLFSEALIRRHWFLFMRYRSTFIYSCCNPMPLRALGIWRKSSSCEIFGKVAPRNFCVFLKSSLKTFPKATPAPRHISSFDLSQRILLSSHLEFYDRCSHIAIAPDKLICSPNVFPSSFSPSLSLSSTMI